ncbi:MAG: putative porin [Bacteroidaceae bacterium]|nr:putative porin [Bacteroidaceae bacterium]
MKFRTLLLLTLLSIPAALFSQATRQLETGGNRVFGPDGQGIGNEEKAGRDSTVQDRTVPKDVRAFQISPTLGELRWVEPDTVVFNFQNAPLTEGINGEYNYLGNMGLPRLSRIFFHRPTQEQFIFSSPLDYFVTKPENFQFLNTKVPYTNVTYYRAGNQVNGEERIKGKFGVNAGKRIGLGFNLDYVYGRGRYSDQATALFDAAAFGYYHGDIYGFDLLLDYDKLKWHENGGLTDDRYITDPLSMATGKTSYTPADMPVKLSRTWNENTLRTALFEHHFNMGYYKSHTDSVGDSVAVSRDFIPVMKVFHTVNVDYDARRFITYKDRSNYYAYNILPYDSVDATGYLSVRNAAGLSLIEGFNKWIPFGGSAYVRHEYRNFSLPDTLERRETVSHYGEQNIILGGNLRRTTGKAFHFDVTAETVFAGSDLGAFSLEGNGELNIPIRKDTLHVGVDGFMKNTQPSFYYRHFHSQHYWWDNDFSKEFRVHMGGTLAYDRTHTRLTAGIENILNYTYLDFAGYLDSETGKTYHDVKPFQCPTNIQVLGATLNQDFALGVLHWDNEITAQYSSRNDILPLPLINVYSNLYLKFTYAKVLRIQIGADVRFFSDIDIDKDYKDNGTQLISFPGYYAPDYAPALGQYHLQNQADRVLIGGYPITNAYANFHLKQVRVYVMYYHVTQGLFDNANSFLVPHYPINPRWFKLGLSWNFWD